MKNKIDSWKSGAIQGLKLGIISFLLLTLFVCLFYYLIFGGQSYIGKAGTIYINNGVPFTVAEIIFAALAAVVPIVFLRYTKIKFLIPALFVSMCTYLLLYILCVLFGEIISFGLLFPMEEFDTIVYALIDFPIGSCIGTVISIVINRKF